MKLSMQWLALPALALPGVAMAHTGLGTPGGFASGFSHPWLGLDHLLTMLAVGIWARQQGGKATWAIPSAFLGAMLVGGALALKGVHLPGVEQGIAASVMITGLVVAMALRLPTAVGMLLVGVFAIFHGHAHGSEMPLAADATGYAAGFLLATAALHGLGVAIGACAGRLSAWLVRVIGAAVAIGGACLALI